MPINVNSRLVRRNGADFVLVDDSDLGGGYRAVADLTARAAIPSSMLKVGMLVFVDSDVKRYRLTSTSPITWVEDTGGGGGLPPIGVLGAVDVEDPAGTVIRRRLTANDIDPAFSVTAFSPGFSTSKEIGEEIINPQFTAAYGGAALAGATLADGVDTQNLVTPFLAFGYGAPGAFPARTYTKSGVNQTVTHLLTATKLGGSPVSASSITSTWRAGAFFGFTIEGTHDEAFVEALGTKRIQAGFTSNTYAFAAPPAAPLNYLFVALPTAWGDPATWKDQNGDTFPMTKVTSAISVTNATANPATITYELWRSSNAISGFSFTLTAA